MTKTKKKTYVPPEIKKRTYQVPVEYLSMVADRILTTSPTKAIILNSLKGVYCDGANYGYFRRMRESKDFKDSRESIIKKIFDAIKDRIDDNIHSRSNNEKK